MEKIISLYPDIFRECFDDLTELHKYVLIASALSTSHLRTTSKIKQYIKENMKYIILFVKCFDRMGSTDEAIEDRIDEALGLNPLITHYHKKTMQRMLKRGNLRKISKRKINTIKRLNDVPKTAEFNYLQQDRWIPLQNVTEYELERIEFKSILKVNTMF